MATNKMSTVSIGRFGEDAAEAFLKSRGWTIIERNFRVEHLEVDIIATRNDVFAFIEVKSRKLVDNNVYGAPINAVNLKKRKNIVRAAELYLLMNQIDESLQINLDIIEVYIVSESGELRVSKIRHFLNAYTADT